MTSSQLSDQSMYSRGQVLTRDFNTLRSLIVLLSVFIVRTSKEWIWPPRRLLLRLQCSVLLHAEENSLPSSAMSQHAVMFSPVHPPPDVRTPRSSLARKVRLCAARAWKAAATV